jgi:outer membrane protein assembly factor BamB
MKNITLLLALFLTLNLGYSQSNIDLNPASHSLLLRITGEDGTNSGGVAYNPNFNLYYTVISGNADFPLEIFSEDGSPFHQTLAGRDLRGIWYNPEFNTVESNLFQYHDIIEFLIDDDNGVVFDPAEVLWELNIADEQAALSYNSADYFYVLLDHQNGVIVEFDSEVGNIQRELKLELPVPLDDINTTSGVYTGIDGGEYGVYDFIRGRVYLVDKNTGKTSYTIQLPEDAPKNDFLNFAFANGSVWLFDIEQRNWKGYKVVKS